MKTEKTEADAVLLPAGRYPHCQVGQAGHNRPQSRNGWRPWGQQAGAAQAGPTERGRVRRGGVEAAKRVGRVGERPPASRIAVGWPGNGGACNFKSSGREAIFFCC